MIKSDPDRCLPQEALQFGVKTSRRLTYRIAGVVRAGEYDTSSDLGASETRVAKNRDNLH